MNGKNMIHTVNDGTLSTTYDCGIIKQSKIDEYGHVTFLYADNTLVFTDISKYLDVQIAYINQFGLSLTEDGRYFFIQDWQQGLLCFECRTGNLKWQKKNKAMELVVMEAVVICHFSQQGVEAIDIQSGSTLYRTPLGYNTIFRPINDKLYLIGPKRKKYLVLNDLLNVVTKIDVESVNPQAYDVFIINQVEYAEDSILIQGFEYSNTSLAEAQRSKKTDSFIETSRFSRCIHIEC